MHPKCTWIRCLSLRPHVGVPPPDNYFYRDYYIQGDSLSSHFQIDDLLVTAFLLH
jgi:hypothetical protein